MKSKNSIYLLFLLCMASQVNAQVIYERTYPNAYPSLQEAIQLSDFSTVSFSKNSTCHFAGWRHISPTGSLIEQGGLAGESTHTLTYKQIAADSILISCRVGPLDYPGDNFFKVALWTPDSLYTIVLDTVFNSYWEDTVHYEAFLFEDNHVLYQRGDTLYSRNILTGQTDFRETFFHITHIYPVKDGLMVFSAGLPPTYFNSQLAPVKTWLNLSAHPISFNSMVAMDSFIVGINVDIPTALHAVNAFNENVQDIDLSDYFSQIDTLVVRSDTLIVIGSNGATGNTVQIDKQFQILVEKPFVYPDNIYPWKLSFYPDRLYAWRIDGFSGYGADYRIAYPFLDPEPITYVNLTFIDISVDSVYLYSPSPGSPYILRLSANIINNSVDTLRFLTIHYEEEPFQFCDPGVYPSHIYDLATPPGDTAVVKLSAVVWADQIDDPFIRTFFVQHGNHQLDSNRTDNSFRLDYLISNAQDPVRAAVSVYPNPFTDFLVTTDESDATGMSLYDQTSRLVASGYGQLENLGRLPSGIYFLQISTGNSTSIQRVVKVE